MHSPALQPWSGWSILSLGPIDQEIGQCLRLDCCPWLILDTIICNLDCPLGHSARCISAANDVGQWSRTDHCDQVSLEIWLQSLGRHVHSITHLLVVGIVLLGRREHFTDIIHRPLNRLCLVLLGPFHHHHCTDHPTGCRYV